CSTAAPAPAAALPRRRRRTPPPRRSRPACAPPPSRRARSRWPHELVVVRRPYGHRAEDRVRAAEGSRRGHGLGGRRRRRHPDHRGGHRPEVAARRTGPGEAWQRTSPGLTAAQVTVSGCPPDSVTTIVCSECAAREPSTVTTAQPSRLCL